jgi:mRNA interferase MazF
MAYLRGDIVAVDFPYSDGSDSKYRPAVVLAAQTIEPTGDVIVLMISSQQRHEGYSVELSDFFLTEPMPKQSFVRCHRLFAMDAKLVLGKLSSLTPQGMKRVLNEVVNIIS